MMGQFLKLSHSNSNLERVRNKEIVTTSIWHWWMLLEMFIFSDIPMLIKLKIEMPIQIYFLIYKLRQGQKLELY